MPEAECIRFRIALSAERFLRYYEGQADAVIVQSEDGRRIQVPASSLRSFVTGSGIHGLFELQLDENRRLISLSRIG